jgi:hypothetical protein
MTTVATLAATLQTLFTTTAQLLGRSTGLIRRARSFSLDPSSLAPSMLGEHRRASFHP